MNSVLGSGLPAALALIVMGVVLLAHLGMAIAVFTDPCPRRVMMPRFVWGLVTLITGLAGLTVYYVLHYGLPLQKSPGDGEYGAIP